MRTTQQTAEDVLKVFYSTKLVNALRYIRNTTICKPLKLSRVAKPIYLTFPLYFHEEHTPNMFLEELDPSNTYLTGMYESAVFPGDYFKCKCIPYHIKRPFYNNYKVLIVPLAYWAAIPIRREYQVHYVCLAEAGAHIIDGYSYSVVTRIMGVVRLRDPIFFLVAQKNNNETTRDSMDLLSVRAESYRESCEVLNRVRHLKELPTVIEDIPGILYKVPLKQKEVTYLFPVQRHIFSNSTKEEKDTSFWHIDYLARKYVLRHNTSILQRVGGEWILPGEYTWPCHKMPYNEDTPVLVFQDADEASLAITDYFKAVLIRSIRMQQAYENILPDKEYYAMCNMEEFILNT